MTILVISYSIISALSYARSFSLSLYLIYPSLLHWIFFLSCHIILSLIYIFITPASNALVIPPYITQGARHTCSIH